MPGSGIERGPSFIELLASNKTASDVPFDYLYSSLGAGVFVNLGFGVAASFFLSPFFLSLFCVGLPFTFFMMAAQRVKDLLLQFVPSLFPLFGSHSHTPFHSRVRNSIITRMSFSEA